jgi:hypothetical protein
MTQNNSMDSSKQPSMLSTPSRFLPQVDKTYEINIKNEKSLENEPPESDIFQMKKSLKKTIQKRFEIIGYLGKGSYGCVSKAKCRETGRLVALKTMKNAQLTEYELIKLLREIQLMKKFN